jgi:hypothetical protein
VHEIGHVILHECMFHQLCGAASGAHVQFTSATAGSGPGRHPAFLRVRMSLLDVVGKAIWKRQWSPLASASPRSRYPDSEAVARIGRLHWDNVYTARDEKEDSPTILIRATGATRRIAPGPRAHRKGQRGRHRS